MIFLSTAIAGAQDAYDYNVYISSKGDSLPYRSLKPKKAEAGKKYPLVIFLHGAGERGDDNESQLIHGSQMFLNPVNRMNHPAYVIFPQCPSDGYWAYSQRPKSLENLEADFLKLKLENFFSTYHQLVVKITKQLLPVNTAHYIAKSSLKQKCNGTGEKYHSETEFRFYAE